MSDIDKIKYHLDAVAGCQLATTIAVSILVSQHRGNIALVAAIKEKKLQLHANLIASSASDYKIKAFEETIDSLIESLM